MGTPLVSVIIPCYRQAHYLPGALDSALGQSHPAVEVILVNDGSDDDTELVARRYGDRIHYIWQPNGGLPAARNAGVRAAAGQYLHCLDADDLLHPDALAWLVEAMAGAEDRVALMGHFRFTGDPARDGGPPLVPDPLDAFLPRFLHKNFGPPHSYLAPRRAVVEVGGFDETYRSCEDWHLWVRLALHGLRLVAVPRVGAYYRVHPASMSTNRPRMIRSATRVLLQVCGWFDQRPDLMQRWGPDLLLAVERCLCRHRARGLFTADSAALAGHVRALHERGLRVPLAREDIRKASLSPVTGGGNFSDVAVDRLTSLAGVAAISAAVAALRVLKPAAYRSLREA
jgi:GT2 family glycosyltransferase